MSEQPEKSQHAEMLQILITEHNNLQAIRSATVFEANGRTTLFLGTVSSAVVALAFIGQMSDMNHTFLIFALILLPTLIFMGMVTFIRVNQTGIEDMVAARGINRIRHFYTETAPPLDKYFIMSTHDDMQGYVQNFDGRATIFQQFLSTAGLVNVINSVLTAVFVGLLVFALFGASLLICIAAGVVAFVISVTLYTRYQHTHWAANEKHLKVHFPSEQQS